MKNNFKLTYEVAKWEFNRWFKLKEQIYTILFGALFSVLIFGGISLFDKKNNSVINISVINPNGIQFKLTSSSKIKLLPKNIEEITSQKELLIKKKIDGILIIENIDEIKVITNKKPAWLEEIQNSLTAARQQIKIKEAQISQNQLSEIFQSAQIKTIYTEEQKEVSSSAEKITAGLFIGLMLLGVFFGLAYQFVTITGEKQLRITEVIVSAITPQLWVDGKIIGISLLSLVLLFSYALSSVIFVLISSLFGSGWSIPISFGNYNIIIPLIIYAAAGFLFWNTFFSAIAATINDPNTSARGSLIALPSIPVALAFFALGNPDSILMKILSLFPPTAAPVMAARMGLTSVSFFEIFLSLLFLILSIYYLRKAAGKIFSLSILMYGKEPTWKEISKWLKKNK